MAQQVLDDRSTPGFGPPPSWITGWTAPRHPVRYRLYCGLEAGLMRGPERFDGAAHRMRQRARNAGPEPIFDRSRPTIVR